jgi:hypothetical protein
LPDRRCAAPGCGAKAVARSVFCGSHETTAEGELSLRVAELARAAARLTEANTKAMKARRDEGS